MLTRDRAALGRESKKSFSLETNYSLASLVQRNQTNRMVPVVVVVVVANCGILLGRGSRVVTFLHETATSRQGADFPVLARVS